MVSFSSWVTAWMFMSSEVRGTTVCDPSMSSSSSEWNQLAAEFRFIMSSFRGRERESKEFEYYSKNRTL